MFDLFYIICKSPICSAAYAELMGLRENIFKMRAVLLKDLYL